MTGRSGAIVLDASAAASLVLPSQETPASRALLDPNSGARFVAPDIFVWETCNLAIRYARAHKTNAAPLVEALDSLDVETWPCLTRSQIAGLMDLGLTENLSLFDAAYLALALDLDAPLATRDAGLVRASALAGAPCLDLR